MDLIPTDSTVVDPVSTAPESSSSPITTIASSEQNVKAQAEPDGHTPEIPGRYRAEKEGAKKGKAFESERDITEQTRYIEQIKDSIRGNLSSDMQIEIGRTPKILQEYGAKPHTMSMSQTTLRKIAYPSGYMGGKHNLGFYALEQLPYQLENPVAILRSATQPNSMVIFTEFLDAQGSPVLTALHMDKNGRLGISNEVASMYGKYRFLNFIARQREAGNIVYEDKNRNLQALPVSGLQLSEMEAPKDPIHTIPQHIPDVKAQAEPDGHTPQMRKVIKAYQAAADPNIAAFAQYAISNPGDNKTAIQLGDVSQRQAAEIEALTGISVEGFGTEAKANAFRHIAERHGANGVSDHSMADINDIARMQYVIDNYDSVELLPENSREFRDRNSQRAPLMRLSKRVNGNYYIVEAVPDTNRKKLEVVTAYKEAAHQGRDAQGPRSNVRNAADVTAPSPTIAQAMEEVKAQTQSGADLEQARPAIERYADQSGLLVQWYNDQSRPEHADANGYYENGTIYINEDAENPYLEVFKHELFHSLDGAEKQAVIDFFREHVNENSRAFLDYKARTMQAHRAKNLRYSDMDFWEEYAAQNAEFLLDEQYIERLAQTDRGLAERILAWIRQAMQRIKALFSAPKDYSADAVAHESGRVSGLPDTQLQKAQRLYEKALHGVRGADSGTRYSIETLPDGKRYVQADRQVIIGDDPKQWAKQVEQYINDEIRQGKGVTVYGADGDPLTITRDTAGKARFRNTITEVNGSKRPMTDAEYAAKLRAEAHIDEISQTSFKGKKDVPDTKKHAFAKDGFNYRSAYFKDIDGTYYKLTISVGKNGEVNTVYNVGKLKEASLPLSGSKAGRKSANGGASNTTIPQSGTGVNSAEGTQKRRFPGVDGSSSKRGALVSRKPFIIDSISQDSEAVNTSIREGAQNDTAAKEYDTKYSIKYNDGKPVVAIEDDIFAGHEGEKPHKVIRDYIRSHYAGDFARILESGQRVYFGKDLPGEYTYSKSARNLEPERKNAKNQAAQNLRELVETGTNRRWKKNMKEKHSSDAKYGFYKYATRFQVGGSVYDADVLIRNDADGKKYLYDVVNIKKKPSGSTGQKSLVSHPMQNDRAVTSEPDGFSNSIHPNNETVNSVGMPIRNSAEGKEYLNIKKAATQRGENSPYLRTAASSSTDISGTSDFPIDTTIPQSGTGVNTSIRENQQNDTTKNSLKRSKFYDSVQEADTVTDEVKQRAQETERAYYYRQIGNDETMAKAVAQVEQDVAAAGRRFTSLDGNATTDEIAQGFVLLKTYQDMGDFDAAADVARKLSEIGTQKGRQVQIYSILGRLTPEGMLRYAAKELDAAKRTLAQNPNRWGTWLKNNGDRLRLTAEDAKQITDWMERAQAMPDGRDKAIVLAEVQKLLQSKLPSTLGSKLSALQRISLLLNPKTVVSRNALSNVLMNPIYAASDFAAAGADRLIGAKTGIRTVGAPNYKDQAKGWKKGAFESYDDFRRAVNTRDVQADRFEIGNKLGSGPAFQGSNPMSKALAFLDRTTGFLLDVGDRPFFEGYFLESLNGQMRANKADAPTPDMLDIATQSALEKTWQDDNVVTKSAAKVKSGLNFGMDFGLGSIVVPFVKTPSNIAKSIVELSPVGFAKAVTADAYNFTKAVKNGTATAQMQNRFAKNIGKGIAGIVLYTAGLALAASGVTTGSDDEPDKDVRNFKRNILGISPYSVKIGDRTFRYDWAQPVGAVLSTTADLQKNKVDMDSAANVIANALVTGGNTLFEQSMLSGLSELFGGYEGFIPAVADAVLGMPSQFVPTLSKQAAELVDPYARRTASGSRTDKAVNKVLARVPGATKKLEPVVDALGRDVKRYGGENNLFNVFLNPANVNVANPTAETKEIWRLYEKTGDAEVFPKAAGTSFSDGGVRYTLTPKEQTQFQRTMGRETSDGLVKIMASAKYKNGTDAEKAELVKKVISSAYDKAKAQAVRNRGAAPSKKLEKAVGR